MSRQVKSKFVPRLQKENQQEEMRDHPWRAHRESSLKLSRKSKLERIDLNILVSNPTKEKEFACSVLYFA